MAKVSKKISTPTKPGLLYGWREIDTQSNPKWAALVRQLHNIGKSYGFLRMEAPILEEEKVYLDFYKDQPHLLQKTIFTPLGTKSLALRSSLLPSLLRYYVQNKIYESQPVSKWFYLGNVATQDERGAGHLGFQYGFEVLGNISHLSEAQVIGAVWDYLSGLQIPDLVLEINMLGDNTAQNNYQNTLRDYLKGKDYDLCEECIGQLSGRVLNVLRCDNLGCQLVVAEAPSALDYLDDSSKSHFTNVLEALDELSIPYQLNQYYAGPVGSLRTNFAVKYTGGKRPLVLGEGSYHDMFIKNINGKAMPAFGFVGNLAELMSALETANIELEHKNSSEVFLVPLGELAAKKSLRLFRELIANQIDVHDHFGTEGVKNQLKAAQDYKAPIALIMGQKEAMDEMVILRDVKSGMQEVFSYDKIIDEVRKRLGR